MQQTFRLLIHVVRTRLRYLSSQFHVSRQAPPLRKQLSRSARGGGSVLASRIHESPTYESVSGE